MKGIRLLSSTLGKKTKSNKISTIHQEKGIVTPVEEIKTKNVEVDNSYSIVLEDPGTNKLGVIKAIRVVTGLGLKQAKDFISSVPSVIKKDLNLSDAESIQKTFSDLGAKVIIK